MIEADYPTILDEPARRGLNMVLKWWWEHSDSESWNEQYAAMFFGSERDKNMVLRAMVEETQKERASGEAKKGVFKIDRPEGWKPKSFGEWSSETGGRGVHRG